MVHSKTVVLMTVIVIAIKSTWCFVRYVLHVSSSVGLKPTIPKKTQLLYFATENFEQIRFQSIKVPIPKLQVPLDFGKNGAYGTEPVPK